MFGFVFWFGAVASIPIILTTVFVYPKVYQRLHKNLQGFLFTLICFAAYTFCAVLYLVVLALTGAKPDDISFLFVFIVAGIYFYIRRKLPNPKSMGLFLLPMAVISAVLLYYWIHNAIQYGLGGSAGWISYTIFDGIPFGAIFSELQMLKGWGWLHIISALFPLLSAFIGAGVADYLSEKESNFKKQ